MRENRIKQLETELKYLFESEIKKEILENEENINNDKINIKDIAKEIYKKRGLDITKLNKGIINNLIDSFNNISNTFNNKNKKTKKKMILEIIYMLCILLLMKIPFDLIRDIGYEYIELLSTKVEIFNLWNLLFLSLYTITFICSFVVFIRYFKSKYN